MSKEINKDVSEETKKDAGQESNKKQPLPPWRRIAFTLVILAIIGIAGIMLAGLVVEKMLVSRVEAISKAGYPVSFADIVGSGEVIRTEDAGPIYTNLITRLETEDMQNILQVSSIYRNVITADTMDKLPKELQQSIAQNLENSKSILMNLDKAAMLPMSGFDIGIQNGWKVCEKRLMQIRKALSFLSLRSLFLIGTEDHDRAAISIISMLRGSRVLDTYPILMASSGKQYFLRLACDDIRLLMQKGKVSDKVLDKLLSALIEAASVDKLQRTLMAEQVYRLELARDLIPESTSLKIMGQEIPVIPERLKLPSSSRGKLRLRFIILGFFKEMDGLVTAAEQEWPGPFDYAMKNKDKVTNKLKKQFESIYAYIQIAARSATVTNEIILMLHVEKYRRANGSLPESLEQIAKEIDPAILTDPYTGGKLVYKIEDQSYLIYSTGPDKVDNGGALEGQISQTTGKIEKMPDDLGLRMLVPAE